MLKAILLFIKAHAVATAITTTAVVTTAVATPIVVENYKLDKAVEANLNVLAKSDFQANSNNEITDNNQEVEKTTENKQINENEPLTFKIVEYMADVLVAEGQAVEYTGNPPPIGTVTPTTSHIEKRMEYKIVPSYDKDYSKWTKQEKEAYNKALQELNEIYEERHKEAVKQEEQDMSNEIKNLEEENKKFEKSYSKPYSFKCNDGQNVTWENWRYNSYSKNYHGDIFLYSNLNESGKFGGISKNDFKTIIYPSLMKKIENVAQKDIADNPYGKDEIEKEKQNEINKLNELYNLSD